MTLTIQLATTDDALKACVPILMQLRPQFEEQQLLSKIKQLQQSMGYQIVYAQTQRVVAVAGIRMGEWLHTGKYLEIEELVTSESERSLGYGAQLFDWIVEYAAEQKCTQIKLVSGVSRNRAHQFYQAKGMLFEAHYYSLDV